MEWGRSVGEKGKKKYILKKRKKPIREEGKGDDWYLAFPLSGRSQLWVY